MFAVQLMVDSYEDPPVVLHGITILLAIVMFVIYPVAYLLTFIFSIVGCVKAGSGTVLNAPGFPVFGRKHR